MHLIHLKMLQYCLRVVSRKTKLAFFVWRSLSMFLWVLTDWDPSLWFLLRLQESGRRKQFNQVNRVTAAFKCFFTFMYSLQVFLWRNHLIALLCELRNARLSDTQRRCQNPVIVSFVTSVNVLQQVDLQKKKKKHTADLIVVLRKMQNKM